MSVTEEPQTNGKWVGQKLRRKEDPRMITGRGRYVDDMVVPGMLYMAVVRSPEAHAKITSIDASGAKEQPGVFGVFTGEDLDIASGLPMAWVPPGVQITLSPSISLPRKMSSVRLRAVGTGAIPATDTGRIP